MSDFRSSRAFDAYRAAGHGFAEAYAGVRIDLEAHTPGATPVYGVAVGDHDRLAPVVAGMEDAATAARKAGEGTLLTITNADLADRIDAASFGDRPDLAGLLAATATRLRAR